MLRAATSGPFSSSACSRRQSLQTLTTWLQDKHLPPGPNSHRFASTRHGQHSAEEFETLPRFLRRQLMREQAEKEKSSNAPPKPSKIKPTMTTEPSKPEPPKSTFRSKHFDPDRDATPKSEMKLLEPHVLSERLKKLCEQGKLEDAVHMLKNAPLDAQNTQVWNTMIWETMKAHRYSLAYKLYTDLKRRGFSPTTRTYQTMFNGLSRIQDWSTHTKQLENAASLYENYQRHIASVKRDDSLDPDLSPDPIGNYIRILGSAGKYQEAFDVYYAMDKDGPLAPNRFVYTTMFRAIHAALGDTVEGRVKVAQDARLLWNQMTRASKRNPDVAPDSYTVVSAITALSGGTESDFELAFKIVEHYYGLTRQQEIPQPGQLQLTGESLITILRLCNSSGNFYASAQFYQQIRRRPESIGGLSILDRGHMEEILRADLAVGGPGTAYHSLQTLEWMIRQEITGPNGPKIRPSLSTYNLVAQACAKDNDFNSLKRAFELMTGYHAHDFMDGAIAEQPRKEKRQSGRSFEPNGQFMSYMVATAVATSNRADVRQVLRIVDHLGSDAILSSRGDVQHETSKSAKRREYGNGKFKEAIREAVSFLVQDKSKHIRPEELQTFLNLNKLARGESSEDGQDSIPSRETATPRRRSKAPT